MAANGPDRAILEYYHRLLTRGGPFLKGGRGGKQHARFVWVSQDLTKLMWRKFGEGEVGTTERS